MLSEPNQGPAQSQHAITSAEKKATRLQERLEALSEHQEAERAVNKNTARLRALRLAKEAEDRAEMVLNGLSAPKARQGRKLLDGRRKQKSQPTEKSK